MAGGIAINTGFSVGSPVAIDTRMVLTKDEMVAMNDLVMPELYICLCSDDGQLYIYNKNNEFNDKTGKYRVHESSSESGGMSGELIELPDELYEAVFMNANNILIGE